MFPATPAQRRFWLLNQLQPGGNPALHMLLGMHLRGPVDHVVLERAFNEVVARHEALRTSFGCERGELRQLINPSLALGVPLIDAPHFPETNPVKALDYLMRKEAHLSFDLRNGPLVRARLVRRAPREHLLLLTMHHIVSDGWSNGIVTRDLCALYTALLQDKPSPLPQLNLQFADYADWQQARLAADDFAPQRDYWRRKLAGDLPGLDLPFDRPRSAAPNGLSEVRSRLVPPELVRAAKSLGAGESASAFMVFLAVFQVLLHRYTGQVDFLVTSPNANRERREFESVVGPFVNPLLLRADLHDDPNFRQLIGRVRSIALEAFSNQDIPFELLLDEFQAASLQVNFNYDSVVQQPAMLPNELKLESLPAVSSGTVYDLSASVLEEAEGLRLELEYKTALFDAETIDQMLGHYEKLLHAVITEPASPISALPVVRPTRLTERGRLDRVSLFAPGAGRAAPGSVNVELVRPYLGLHHQLIGIWEELLGVDGIGIRDNFFELGGNSLLAMRMLHRAELACGKTILPATLFTNPTIEDLASEIAR